MSSYNSRTKLGDYWYSFTKTVMEQRFYSTAAKGFLIAASVVIVVGVAAGQLQGTNAGLVLLWVGWGLGLLACLAMAYLSYNFEQAVQDALRIDDAEGRVRLAPLARDIAQFSEKQERFAGLAIKSKDERLQWALSRQYEVFSEWPQEFEQYGMLKSNPGDYHRARRYIAPEYAQDNAPFEKIMEQRYETYNNLRYDTTPEERSKYRQSVSTAIEIAKVLDDRELMQLRKAIDSIQPPPVPEGAADL